MNLNLSELAATTAAKIAELEPAPGHPRIRPAKLIYAALLDARKQGMTDAIEAAHPVGIRCGTSPMGDAYNKGVNDAIAAIETARDRLDQDTKQ